MSEMKSVALADLVDRETLDRLIPILNEIRSGRVGLSDGKRRISAIIDPHKDALIRKGVVADYLTWWLVNIAVNGGDKDLSSTLLNN